MIAIPEDEDFFRVFNTLQSIYDRFDTWERELSSAALMGDVQNMLDASSAIFGNPIYCIDSAFRVLAVNMPRKHSISEAELSPVDGMLLDAAAVDRYLGEHELSTTSREPMVISLLDQTTLNYNLYDGDSYQGCLTVHYTETAYDSSHRLAIEFLGKYIIQAMKHASLVTTDSQSVLARVVRDIVEERPLDSTGRAILLESETSDPMVCVRIKPLDRSKRMPLGYIASTIENAFEQSMAFEYHKNSVVAVIGIANGLSIDDIRTELDSLADALRLKAGVSDRFEDVAETRMRFIQADRALDIGMSRYPEKNVHSFPDYALYEMIEASASEMPIELLAPAGLMKLALHDKRSSASYVKTLKCFLDNNMNTSKTAKDLFIHRSTLMERLSRVKRELDLDLDDPDIQLQLRMLLKAMEIRGIDG